MNTIFYIFPIFLFLSIFLFENFAFGHGTTAEVMPPVMIGNKNVTLLASAQNSGDFTTDEKQVFFRVHETQTAADVNNVTFNVKASKNNKFLFNHTFQSDTGRLWLILDPVETSDMSVQEERLYDIIGETKIEAGKAYRLSGPNLESRGLYEFYVEILSIDDYSQKLDDPVSYNFGLSFPDKTLHTVDDLNFGKQEISLTSYYDQIAQFEFDPNNQMIRIQVPFEWSKENISLTPFIHEEILIPKTYGDFLVSEMFGSVNDLELKGPGLVIDDSLRDFRTVHLIVNQNELEELSQEQKGQKGLAEFKLIPSSAKQPLSTITEDFHYVVNLSWDPDQIFSGAKTVFIFKILDNFRALMPAAVNYDLTILYDNKEIFKKRGTSNVDENLNRVEFDVPENVSGPITLRFENIADKILAKVELPVVVNRIFPDSQLKIENPVVIPNWIRNNAGWWAKGSIGDEDFIQGIQFLINEKIFLIPETVNSEILDSQKEIPSWIKNNAGWWAEGQIDDNSFVNGIQFLIEIGAIRI